MTLNETLRSLSSSNNAELATLAKELLSESEGDDYKALYEKQSALVTRMKAHIVELESRLARTNKHMDDDELLTFQSFLQSQLPAMSAQTMRMQFDAAYFEELDQRARLVAATCLREECTLRQIECMPLWSTLYVHQGAM